MSFIYKIDRAYILNDTKHCVNWLPFMWLLCRTWVLCWYPAICMKLPIQLSILALSEPWCFPFIRIFWPFMAILIHFSIYLIRFWFFACTSVKTSKYLGIFCWNVHHILSILSNHFNSLVHCFHRIDKFRNLIWMCIDPK